MLKLWANRSRKSSSNNTKQDELVDKKKYESSYYVGADSNFIFDYKNMKYRLFWSRRLEILSRFKVSGVLLDCGCAYGFFLKFLEKDFDIYGLDFSSHAIEQAKNLLQKPEALVCADIQNGIPFKKKFDIITAFDIMEHIANPFPVFKILYEGLNDNGFLYVELPISPTLIDRDTEHVYLPLENWLDLIKKAGFKIVFMQGYYTVGLRIVMIPNQNNVNYCCIVAQKA